VMASTSPPQPPSPKGRGGSRKGPRGGVVSEGFAPPLRFGEGTGG
jgi:hypothetical protein